MQEKSFKNKEVGHRGEELACEYLTERDFRVLDRNFRGAGCEIDIVAMKGGELHFIEVKTRSGSLYGSPFDSVTRQKQARIRRAAEVWLIKSKGRFKCGSLPPCYFGVIGVDLSADAPQIEFVQDAFI